VGEGPCETGKPTRALWIEQKETLIGNERAECTPTVVSRQSVRGGSFEKHERMKLSKSD